MLWKSDAGEESKFNFLWCNTWLDVMSALLKLTDCVQESASGLVDIHKSVLVLKIPVCQETFGWH